MTICCCVHLFARPGLRTWNASTEKWRMLLSIRQQAHHSTNDIKSLLSGPSMFYQQLYGAGIIIPVLEIRKLRLRSNQ